MFKRFMFLSVFALTAAFANADEGQKITSKVQRVTVFLSGAQVTRTATVKIPEGVSIIVFDNLSPNIDASSISVHADGEFTILSVKHENSYITDPVKTKLVETLEAEKKDIYDKINFQNSLLSIFQSEENTLMKNQLVKAENATLDVLKLKQALDFQTERLTAIKEKELAINKVIAGLNSDAEKITERINQANTNRTKNTGNILVTVSSKQATESTFSLSYLIRQARWYASYDINAKNINSPLLISYNANVSQTSGEEWKNVKITLSTGNPISNSSKLELSANYLTFFQPIREASINADMAVPPSVIGGFVSGVAVTNKKNFGYSNADKLSETVPVAVTNVENQTNFEFKIDNPYTIESDGKICTVAINKVEVNAKYQYAVVPKLSTDVFLTAQLTDWNKYNFLSGEANLFFEGTYIGKSVLDTHSTADTLNLSLGSDKNIVVTRTLQKELSVRQSLGSNKKETKDWQIEIKNRKGQAINLLVEDQVPVSQNTAIEVETQETSGAKVDPLTGKLTWSFQLKPQEDKKLEIRYQVKYPKNQTVIVQ